MVANFCLKEIIREMKRFSKEDFMIGRELYDKLIQSDIHDAEREGLEQGIKQGIKQGQEEGRMKQSLVIAKSMLEDNMDMNIISKYTGISIQELQSLK